MSGNRANASARTRRAGEPMPPPPGRGMPPRPMMQQQMMQQMQQQQMQQQQMQQQQHNPSFAAQAAQGLGAPKQMTIQDAVALMTIRLSRVETFVQKFESEQPGDENSRIVDDGVFNSIVSRLDALERGHKLLVGSQSLSPVTIPSETVVELNANFDGVKSEFEKVKTDVSELKDLLLKLQSFTMDTNQKLLEVVLGEDEEQNDQQQVVFIGDNVQDYIGQDLVGSLNVNLKELIQQELAKTNESEVVEEEQ